MWHRVVKAWKPGNSTGTVQKRAQTRENVCANSCGSTLWGGCTALRKVHHRAATTTAGVTHAVAAVLDVYLGLFAAAAAAVAHIAAQLAAAATWVRSDLTGMGFVESFGIPSTLSG